MARDEGSGVVEIDAALLLQHPQHSHRQRHQRRLGVLRQDQFLFRPLEHQPRQVLAQRVVDFLEYLAGGRLGLGKRLAHAHGLTALAGKNERSDHRLPPLNRACRTVL